MVSGFDAELAMLSTLAKGGCPERLLAIAVYPSRVRLRLTLRRTVVGDLVFFGKGRHASPKLGEKPSYSLRISEAGRLPE
jgi:hypothetical protein